MGTFGAFLAANLAALALNASVMRLGLNVHGLPETFAFAAATGVTFLRNLGASKFIVFRA